MKPMKKFVALALAIMVATALAACAPAAPTSTQAPMAADGKPISIGFAQVGAESDWRAANTKSMRETFSEANGYQFEMVDCQQQPALQIEAIRGFIKKGVDYIVLAPIIETGYDTVLGEARAAGIPVIIVDRMIKTYDESLFTAWVGSNFLLEGYSAVTALETVLEKRGVPEDKAISIMTIQGTMGSSAQLGRTEGFAEKMLNHKNWIMLERQPGDFTEASGEQIMASLLEKYPEVDVVISENDNMAFGAIKAIKAAGKTCGPKGDIIIISFDAVKAAFQAMTDGNIDAVVECNPLHGPRVEGIIRALEANQKVDKIAYVQEEIFYAEDAAEIMPKRTY